MTHGKVHLIVIKSRFRLIQKFWSDDKLGKIRNMVFKGDFYFATDPLDVEKNPEQLDKFHLHWRSRQKKFWQPLGKHEWI